MRALLTASLLLTVSCAAQPLRERLIKSQRLDTYQIGFKCPNDHYLGTDGLCHYIGGSKPINQLDEAYTPSGIYTVPNVEYIDTPSKVVKVKKVKIDCKRVFKQINYCSGSIK